jgi:hypothetical protein
MSTISQIETHPVYNAIPDYINTLRSVENDTEFLITLTEYGTKTVKRINATYIQINIRLNSTDPYLNRVAILDSIHSDASNINSYLQNYTSYLNNESYLNQINSYIDNLLSYLVALVSFDNVEQFEGLQDSVMSFRSVIDNQMNIMEEQHNELSQKNQELLSQFDELSNSFTNLLERFETQKTSFQEDLDSKLQGFNEQWEELKNTNNKVINENLANLSEEQQNFFDETKKKQETYDNILNEHKKSVESLVGIISTNSISGHFKEVADKKQTLTTIWHVITIIGFLGTIGFAIYSFIYSGEMDWPSLVARIIVTAGFGSFTAYAARQVNKNEHLEQDNRQMEVELKTLNPYIASFSEEDQIRLKEQLFPLIFGRKEFQELNEHPLNLNINNLTEQDINTIAEGLEILLNLKNNRNV